jgi:hypothetical protein
MKFLISKVKAGHYECYYKGQVFTISNVDISIIFPGTKYQWMWEMQNGKQGWEDNKKNAIESAKKQIDNDHTRRTTRVIRMASAQTGQDNIYTPKESTSQRQPVLG